MKLDPRQAKSKGKLHEAYLSLIIEGHDQLSIQQVCSKATVTRPTFYKLYKDINELRKAMIEELLSELKQALTINNPKSLAEITEEEQREVAKVLIECVEKTAALA